MMKVSATTLLALCLASSLDSASAVIRKRTLQGDDVIFTDNGSAGKGKGKGKGSCDCSGFTYIKYISADEVPVCTEPLPSTCTLPTATAPPTGGPSPSGITFLQAVEATPASCTLAPIESIYDYYALLAVFSEPGFVGVFKDFEDVYNDQGADRVDQFMNWRTLTGGSVPTGEAALVIWAAEEPADTPDSVTEQIAVLTSAGLEDVDFGATSAGAYYSCCVSTQCT